VSDFARTLCEVLGYGSGENVIRIELHVDAGMRRPIAIVTQRVVLTVEQEARVAGEVSKTYTLYPHEGSQAGAGD
jgi:hypothetical protein